MLNQRERRKEISENPVSKEKNPSKYIFKQEKKMI